jgi:hypothetical protein
MKCGVKLWVLAALAVCVSACPDDDPVTPTGDGDITSAETSNTVEDSGPDGSPDVSAMADIEAADAEPEVTASADAEPEVTQATDAEPEVTTGADALPDVGPSDDVAPEPDVEVPDAAETTDGSADVPGPEPCQSACECPQGEACVDGVCALGAAPVFCCEQDECPDGGLCTSTDGLSSLCGATPSPAAGSIVINELLIDGAVSGDPNGDSDPSDPMGDEFVEIVNAGSEEIALDGFTLEETTFVGLPRHTFAPGTTIGPGNAIVIFGGGSSPDDIPGTHFAVANAADVGISFGLSLDDDGDTLTLLDASGDLVAVFAWGPAAPLAALSDQSYTRSPDVTGEFTPHDDAQPNVFFSPGTKVDGSSF